MVQQRSVTCFRCGDLCQGETVRAYGSYYHIYCFSCGVSGCAQDLMSNGYFLVGDEIYCRRDYHKLMGRRCAGCNKYVEGEVISVLNSVYHTRCFGCTTCSIAFPPNAEIFYDGEDFFCETCVTSTVAFRNDISTSTLRPTREITTSDIKEPRDHCGVAKGECFGCKNEIKTAQTVIALDKPWHVQCFKCHKCKSLLTGDYMERDGYPYCESDFHANFGVVCDNCGEFITGKVLQAGEKLYHPKCSKCVLCEQAFQEGEEMFLQGEYIWHPKCSDKLKEDEKRNKRKGTLFPDDDSDDCLTDSTLPISENYDASRSYNDMSDVTLNEDGDFHIHPMIQRNLQSYNNQVNKCNTKDNSLLAFRKNNTEIRKPNVTERLHTKDDASMQNMIVSIEQLDVEERYRNDLCSDLTEADRAGRTYHNISKAPINAPGCFRNVNSVLLANKRKTTLIDKDHKSINSKGVHRSKVDAPPMTGDLPPPIPPPPTRESSKQWQKKYVNVVHNSEKVRRPSFSKAITIGTDESSMSTDSETFPSTVNTSTSTDEFGTLIDEIPTQKKINGLGKKMKFERRKCKDGSRIAKDFNFKYATSYA